MRIGSVWRTLRTLPDEVIEASPALLIARGWTLHFRNRYPALVRLVDRLVTLLDAHEDSLGPRLVQYRGHVSLFRAVLSFAGAAGEEMASHGLQALDLLPSESKFGRGLATIGVGIGLQSARRGHGRRTAHGGDLLIGGGASSSVPRTPP